ncbi:MAG: DUF4838 domain-containing protein [Victivallales bacterium]|nr:DUF4838 domain-containing protein [Victivallales bacterium]
MTKTLMSLELLNPIELPENPQVYEVTAAEELRHCLALVTEQVMIDGKTARFLVGNTETAKKAGVNCDEMEDEGWLAKSLPDGQVLLCGGGTRGTLYATLHFLEQQMGVRWLTPVDEFIPPKKKRLELAPFEMAGRPVFRIRNVYRAPKPEKDRGRFAMHLRLNQEGEWPLIDQKYGGDIVFGSPSHCHSIEMGYFPLKTYFKEHPEYYALIDGKRNGSMYFGQICVSRPGLAQEFTEKLKSFILADEAKAKAENRTPPRIYDISLNDSRGFCQCPECSAKVEKYGASGAFLLALNQVALELKKFRPGYYLQTLGYFATTDPPRGGIVPADNILVRTCNTATYLHEKIDSDLNAHFRRQVEAWGNAASQLCPWEYSITYGAYGSKMPYPSEFTIADNLRFYAKNKAIGMFFEHENPDSADMYDLKVYLEAKLMENPNQDETALMQEFCRLFYGSAAPFLLQYRNGLRKAAFRNHAGVRFFFPFAVDFCYIGWSEMREFQGIIDQALATVAGDETLTNRVVHAANTLDYLLLCGLPWWYRLGAVQANQLDEYERLRTVSKARLFSGWRKACADLEEHEGRSVSAKTKATIGRLERHCQVDFGILPQGTGSVSLTPDVFATQDEGATWLEDRQAAAGVCLQVTPQFTKAKEGADPNLAIMGDNESADSRELLFELRDYGFEDLHDISLATLKVPVAQIAGERFVPITMKDLPIAQGRPIFSIGNRRTLNFRLDFLSRLWTADHADLTVFLRLRDKLEVSHVVISPAQ